MTDIFIGEPPANIKTWIIEHYVPAGHADTWYKYANDTEWRTVSIVGEIEGNEQDDEPTSQIPDVTNVVALEIGTDVTSIGNSAFMDCNLVNVVLGNNVASIGTRGFAGCSKLTNITFNNNLTSISNHAFIYDSGITALTIPDSVLDIGEETFSSCGVIEIQVGSGIRNIGYDAFRDCNNLTSITFKNKTLDQLQSMDNYSWGIDDTSIIHVA